MKEKILVVDDEPGVRSALEAILTDENFDVTSVGSGEDGIDAVSRQSFDAVLLDVWLPGIDGLETLRQVRDLRPDTEIVMISGHGTIETAVRATKLGAFDFIEKPLSLDKTLLVLRNALRQRRLERANRQLLAQLVRDTEIQGSSAAAERLRRQVELAAQADTPVLICGPPGSGRENVARRIHSTGSRATQAFVEVPCGALDRDTAEHWLFGGDGAGSRIDLAHHGTLFLEDADRLAPELQRRLGARVDSTADAPEQPRVLASVGVEPSGLDPELRQSLEVLRIDVPSLRDRVEDIPLLAERFLHDLAREYGREPRRWAPECLQALTEHSWPGEIRELRNMVEHVLLLARDTTIGLQDLPQGVGEGRLPRMDLQARYASLADGVAAFERYLIQRTLAEEQGDLGRAARRLKISASDLKRRLD